MTFDDKDHIDENNRLFDDELNSNIKHPDKEKGVSQLFEELGFIKGGLNWLGGITEIFGHVFKGVLDYFKSDRQQK